MNHRHKHSAHSGEIARHRRPEASNHRYDGVSTVHLQTLRLGRQLLGRSRGWQVWKMLLEHCWKTHPVLANVIQHEPEELKVRWKEILKSLQIEPQMLSKPPPVGRCRSLQINIPPGQTEPLWASLPHQIITREESHRDNPLPSVPKTQIQTRTSQCPRSGPRWI